jgi:SAM-dependent methyltransferase
VRTKSESALSAGRPFRCTVAVTYAVVDWTVKDGGKERFRSVDTWEPAAYFPLPMERNSKASATVERLRTLPSVEEFAEAMWDVQRGRRRTIEQKVHREVAAELGLVEPRGNEVRLTDYGEKAVDSLREYLFWMRRERRHNGSEHPALELDRLKGKRILEIGCGSGINLLSLQPFASVVGADIEPIYLHFAEVFAKLEGQSVPELVRSPAEQLPFGAASFDLVLFPGSLQYMEIRRALREVSRVLAPGGRAIVVVGHFGGYLRESRRRVRSSGFKPRAVLRETRAVAGMLLYPWVGRAFLAPFAEVYPTKERLLRWISDAGLRPNLDETAPVGDREICYVADKA